MRPMVAGAKRYGGVEYVTTTSVCRSSPKDSIPMRVVVESAVRVG